MKLLFANFISYDWIIFALAAVNGVVFFISLQRAKGLYETVAPRINISSGFVGEAIREARENNRYFRLYERWQKAEFSYTLYCNLTGIFTLLGILGTVISLLHLVDTDADMSSEFMGALTSTLWGIIFTIVFKVLDSAISYHLEMGERITELVQMREYENRDNEKAEEIPKAPVTNPVGRTNAEDQRGFLGLLKKRNHDQNGSAENEAVQSEKKTMTAVPAEIIAQNATAQTAAPTTEKTVPAAEVITPLPMAPVEASPEKNAAEGTQVKTAEIIPIKKPTEK